MATREYRLRRGDYWELTLRYLGPNRQPVDTTGYTGQAVVTLPDDAGGWTTPLTRNDDGSFTWYEPDTQAWPADAEAAFTVELNVPDRGRLTVLESAVITHD